MCVCVCVFLSVHTSQNDHAQCDANDPDDVDDGNDVVDVSEKSGVGYSVVYKFPC